MLERLGYDDNPRGEVALNRRFSTFGDTGYELIVNGAFVMDTNETSTERLLATSALERLTGLPGLAGLAGPGLAGPAYEILVGGLGLGFTVQALLADARIARIDVVELEPALVGWITDGLVPHTAGVLSDHRVHVHVSDIRADLPVRADASLDAILLDVDNGPDWLVHAANSEVYEKPFLVECRRVLRPQGLLSVWSAARARALQRLLRGLFGSCEELHRKVKREGRLLDYYLYIAGAAD